MSTLQSRLRTGLTGAAIPAICRALLVAAVITGCGDVTGPRDPSLPVGGPANLSIKDGSNGGYPGFYFISPIAPTLASYPGTFDVARAPVVEICTLVSGACSGSPVATFSGASIETNVPGQYYRANWPTAALPAGVLYRIRILEGGIERGFADARKPGPGETAAGLTAQKIVPLGNSGSLAIRFRLSVNNPPTVSIGAPADGAIIPVTNSITFTGTASDLQQGDLSSSIVWTSNKVVSPLGTGASITVSLPGGRHTITASVTDASGATTTATQQLVVSIVSVPATLNVPYGGTASLPITLSEPAPAGGITFTVSSNHPSVGVTTTSVTVPAGTQAANATLSGASPGTATVTVSHVDYGTASSQVSTTANLNIVDASVSFNSDVTKQITVELRSAGVGIAAPAGGLTVTLTAANPSCVVAPPSVTIPAGLVSMTATLSYVGPAATPCTTTVTASTPAIPAITSDGVSATVQTPPPPPPTPVLSITLFGGNRVGAGLSQNSVTRVSLSAPAPAGGLVVSLASSDAAIAVVAPSNPAGTVGTGTASVTLGAGATIADFRIDGMEGASGTVTITASAPGYISGTSGMTIAPLALRMSNPLSSTTTLTANTGLVIEVGALDAGGTVLAVGQPIRPGGTPRTVTITNSAAGVAELVTTALTGQTVTSTIGVGQSQTGTVAAGGVAFKPLGPGSTTIAIASPGATLVPFSSQLVTVSQPGFSFTYFGGIRVGAGLSQAQQVRVTLGAPAPAGGLVVSLTSSDAAVAVAAPFFPQGAVVGSGTATITIGAGVTTADFRIDGMEGASGPVTFAASAPGFSGASAGFTVTPTAYSFQSVPTSTTTLTPNILVSAQLGAVDALGTGLILQAIRPGGTPRTVTFTTSHTSVGELATSAATGATVSATIGVGQNRTPGTVATGGVEFNPLTAGTTTVAVSIAGATPVLVSSQLVTVSQPGFSFTFFGGTRVGAGLSQAQQVRVTLGAPAPAGGLVVSLASSDAAIAVAAPFFPQGAAVGSATATITIGAGVTNADFRIDGMEGASGPVTFTASAPGFSGAAAGIMVTPTAYSFQSVFTSATTLTPNILVSAQVGAVDALGTGLILQAIRVGGTPRTITFANSNPAVAQLVTSALTAGTVSATIDVGQYQTPNTVAAGGVFFDPLGVGSTTITITSTGATAVPVSSRVITVAPPTFTFTLFGGDRVGAGLSQNSVTRLTLSAPAPSGGLVLSLASSAPGVALVAPSVPAGIVGTGTGTVTLAPGATVADFRIDGVEGASGTVTLTASAPGFTDATTTFTVTPLALRFASGLTSTTSGAANAAVTAQVGALDLSGTAMGPVQGVRPGGTAIAVTFTNSNAAAAQLVTTALTGQAVTASIVAGASATATTVALGGVAFDPLAVGSTTVAVSAPGATLVPPSSQAVVINP